MKNGCQETANTKSRRTDVSKHNLDWPHDRYTQTTARRVIHPCFNLRRADYHTCRCIPLTVICALLKTNTVMCIPSKLHSKLPPLYKGKNFAYILNWFKFDVLMKMNTIKIPSNLHNFNVFYIKGNLKHLHL